MNKDYQHPTIRKFWTNSDGKREPSRACFVEGYPAFLHGKEYYLGQTVYHNLMDFDCITAYNGLNKQACFEAGFGVELHDCAEFVRGGKVL